MSERRANRWRRDSRPLLLAHRGHSIGAPEQTMVAFADAIRLGADAIEADVHLTRDGQLVMLHDETLERTTDGHGPVAEHTLADLARLDAGSWFGDAFRGERIPTLDDLLDLAEVHDTILCLEAKGRDHGEYVAIATATASRLRERGLLDRHVLASFDHQALAEAARVVTGVILAPDRLPERGLLATEAVIEQARRIGAPIMQAHHAELTADDIRALHEADLAIWAWPTTLPADIERTRAIGADGLMGDDVVALMAAVAA
jgi:glycerophosphoryl diester phosphodiesterase